MLGPDCTQCPPEHTDAARSVSQKEPPMPPNQNHDARLSVPWPALARPEPPEHEQLPSGLRLLDDWRQGSGATAVVMAALLPFAVAWHVSYLVAIAASLAGAVALAAGCHVARELRLNALMIFPEFAHLPQLAGRRARLVSPRNRRAVASSLRRTLAPTRPPRRFDCCPVLADRVATVRPALLQLAGALERNTEPEPASVALVQKLLSDGCGPLYNPNVPVDELHRALARVRAGILQPARAAPADSRT
jgi:hypothetical protein